MKHSCPCSIYRELVRIDLYLNSEFNKEVAPDDLDIVLYKDYSCLKDFDNRIKFPPRLLKINSWIKKIFY